MPDLAEMATLLRTLHVPGAPLVLPNVWDVGSALAVVDAGFPVVATASNAVAASLGFDDGEHAPFEEMFGVARRIAAAVNVPVTVDAEAGYGLPADELVDRLVAIGAVGCNIEDSNHRNGGLVELDVRADYIEQMRAAASVVGVPLVINARVDSFFPTSPLADHEKLDDAVARGRAYRAAGPTVSSRRVREAPLSAPSSTESGGSSTRACLPDATPCVRWRRSARPGCPSDLGCTVGRSS
jgi:2-methylisocitrate lyase-like PEP mutase family enzyme